MYVIKQTFINHLLYLGVRFRTITCERYCTGIDSEPSEVQSDAFRFKNVDDAFAEMRVLIHELIREGSGKYTYAVYKLDEPVDYPEIRMIEQSRYVADANENHIPVHRDFKQIVEFGDTEEEDVYRQDVDNIGSVDIDMVWDEKIKIIKRRRPWSNYEI